MQTTELPTLCPFCKTALDAATYVATTNDGSEVVDHAPGIGDVTLCLSCGEFAIFDGEPLQLRVPKPDEYMEIGTDPELRRVRETWARTMADRQAARDKPQEPAKKVSVLDELFEPIALKVTERGVADDIVMRMKTVFAMGCKATLQTMSYNDETVAQEMIDRLAAEVDAFFKDHPALVRNYMKGRRP